MTAKCKVDGDIYCLHEEHPHLQGPRSWDLEVELGVHILLFKGLSELYWRDFFVRAYCVSWKGRSAIRLGFVSSSQEGDLSS